MLYILGFCVQALRLSSREKEEAVAMATVGLCMCARERGTQRESVLRLVDKEVDWEGSNDRKPFSLFHSSSLLAPSIFHPSLSRLTPRGPRGTGSLSFPLSGCSFSSFLLGDGGR